MNHHTASSAQPSLLSVLIESKDYDLSSLSKLSYQIEALTESLYQACSQLQLDLSTHQYWQLLKYLDTLLLWNKTYNLTAITEPSEAMVKHVIDCLAIIPTLNDLQRQVSANQLSADVLNDMLDIGTGAGLPAVIVAICQPQRMVTPLDSNQKKIRFIRQVSGELGLKNITPVASRIERFEGCFHLITSRAFSSLHDFVSLASPYLASDGQLLAMKGKAPSEQELKQLSDDWLIDVITLNVPYLTDSRHLVKLTKND